MADSVSDTAGFGGGSDWGGGGSFGGGGDFGGVFKGIGGLVGGIFDSKASSAEAGSYETAAKIADENARLTEEETGIKQFEEERKLSHTIGTQEATIAANGFQEGGSGAYILADSARQGALASGMIGVEGQIQENAYKTQAEKARGEAAAARAASKKSMMGGMFSAVSSIIGFL